MYFNVILVWVILSLAVISTALTTFGRREGVNDKHFDLIDKYTFVFSDPCTSFYDYACGAWNRTHPAASFVSTFSWLDSQVNREYESILYMNEENLSKEHRFMRQTLNYYESCKSQYKFMPEKYLRILEIDEGLTWPDIEHVNEPGYQSTEFWKMVDKEHDSSNPSQANRYWFKMWATLRKYGMDSVFINEYVYARPSNSSQNIITIEKPMLIEDFKKMDRLTFETLMELMGIDDLLKVSRFWEFINRLETTLLKLYDIEDNDEYEELKLSELPFPELKPYLEIVMNTTNLDVNTEIAIRNRAYINRVFDLLNDFDDEYICRYLTVRFLNYLYDDGPYDFSKRSCISSTRAQFPLSMSWLYEQKYRELLSQRSEVERIFESLRAHFAEVLTANPNKFDDEILKFLHTKLQRMQLKVGNIPRNNTLQEIESYYNELSLSNNDFYGNHLMILRFIEKKEVSELEHITPQNAENVYYRDSPPGFGAISTATYYEAHNVIVVPVTLLHLPFYAPQFHDIFKYSILGFLLGHEMTHGFDKTRSKYDGQGNVQEHIGKLIKANEHYAGHLNCLEKLNPQVVDEKIPDVNGLRLAYETYFGGDVKPLRIPTSWTERTQEQLFFLSYALFYCGDEDAYSALVNTTHGTDRSRLHDSVSQFAEFGKAFNCQSGTPMNPVRKCQLW